MFIRSVRFCSVLCALCLLCGVGCGPAGSVSSSGSTVLGGAPAPTPPPATVTGNCQQGYVPLRAGYAADYQTDATGAGTHDLSERVVRSNGRDADVEMLVDGRSITHQHFVCDDRGIVHALSYLDPSMTRMGTNIRIDPSTVTGDWLPAEIERPGASADMEVHGGFTLNNAGMVSPTHIAFTLRMHRQVVGQETVTVPAGTYQAVKLDVATSLSLNGSPTPPFHSTEWWVKNVGLVQETLVDGGQLFRQRAVRFVIP